MIAPCGLYNLQLAALWKDGGYRDVAPNLGSSYAAILLPLQRLAMPEIVGMRAPWDILANQKTLLAWPVTGRFYTP